MESHSNEIIPELHLQRVPEFYFEENSFGPECPVVILASIWEPLRKHFEKFIEDTTQPMINGIAGVIAFYSDWQKFLDVYTRQAA